jgi:5S rRNA maturation endonuclease (ribonuclease M5)
LKYGIRNTIALNGAKLPRSLPKLVRDKKITLFVDGDRGGDLIAKNLTKKLSINLTVKAPDGKEVEELTQKEILMALRGKNASKIARKSTKTITRRTPSNRSDEASLPSDTTTLKELHDEIVGDGAAVILDDALQILGRVPVKELDSVLEELDGAQAIVMDGKTSATIMRSAYKAGLKYIVASKKPTRSTAVKVYTVDDL